MKYLIKPIILKQNFYCNNYCFADCWRFGICQTKKW